MQAFRDSQELAQMNGIRSASRQWSCLRRYKSPFVQLSRSTDRPKPGQNRSGK
jgi:hypothetical protein